MKLGSLWRGPALVVLVAVACSDPAVDSRGGPVPGVTRTFEGTWSASGPRRFASSYFSTITPQGCSQNVIFVGSGYLTQGELYRLGALTTAFCLLVFLLLGTPWLFLVVL